MNLILKKFIPKEGRKRVIEEENQGGKTGKNNKMVDLNLTILKIT